MIVKDGKKKFCNFEGILRKKRWPFGDDALHSIPLSEHGEKLLIASSQRLVQLVQVLCKFDVGDLNFQVFRIKDRKVIYIQSCFVLICVFLFSYFSKLN